MLDAAREQLERNRRLARSLGPSIASRGVLQHFFVSPVVPLKPLSLHDISRSWQSLVSDIRSGRAPELLSLYLHIPFCSHKCRYCIYHSIGDFDPGDLRSYLERLHREIDYMAPIFEGVRFVTCYIGGGTPTVLDEDQLAGLLEHLGSAFARRRGGERAFECNPLTVTEGKARLFEEHGYNRVSFGVQTLDQAVLEGVNRGYQSMERVVETFRVMKACRFRINVDLLHGLPGDTLDSMEQSVRQILDLGPNQVMVYALSPYTPLAMKDRFALPLEDLAGILEPVALEHDFHTDVHGTCVELSCPVSADSDNRLLEEYRATGETHRYDDTTVEPYSVLGMGPTARSYIYNQLVYVFDTYPVAAPLDPRAEIASGRPVAMTEERRRFVVHGLSSMSGLDSTEYSARFGEEPGDTFARELDDLLRLGLLKRVDRSLVHVSADPIDRFATELFFVDDGMFEEALDGTGESEQHHGIVLEAPGARVQVVLVEYWPQRPCFHHSGRFAFYVPSELPEGTCRHASLEENLLSAFRRLFDRVIAEDSPDSIEALHRALFDRGCKLHLTIRTDQGIQRLPVLLSTLEVKGKPA